MIIYSVCTTYHLLEAIVHKINYHKNSEALLLMSSWLQDQYPNYLDFNAFFSNIVVFDGGYTYEDAINGGLNSRFQALLAKEQINLNSASEIHVFGVEHAFGAFIELNHYPYFFWEEGAGAISKTDNMFEIFRKAHGERKAQFQLEHHLGDGSGKFVRGIYYDKYFQKKEVTRDALIHFDLGDELRNMDHLSRDEITNIFCGAERFSVSENSALVLTENFANISITSWQEQQTLYQYLVDYFLSQYNIIFKPHPADLMDYERMFPQSHVVRKRFPAELLPYVFDTSPVCIATSSSTGIYGLRKSFEKCVEFNFAFSHEKRFYDLNKFYIAICIANQYLQKDYTLHLVGVNECIIDNFQNSLGFGSIGYQVHNSIEPTSSQKAIWIIDRIENPHINCYQVCQALCEASASDIFIFINSRSDYCFYTHQNKGLWNYMYPIEITQHKLHPQTRANLFSGPEIVQDTTEYIYVYSKKEVFSVVSMKQKLPNVGVTVAAKGFSDKDLKIKLLEGMLAATEKRLLYYIDAEKNFHELREEQSQ